MAVKLAEIHRDFAKTVSRRLGGSLGFPARTLCWEGMLMLMLMLVFAFWCALRWVESASVERSSFGDHGDGAAS